VACAAFVALGHSAANAQNQWSYTFPYDDTKRATGSWGTVKAFSESTVDAYYATLGISASCTWAGGEPSPPQDTTVPWGGNWVDQQGNTGPCTGSASVQWLGCPAGTVWVSSAGACKPYADKNDDKPDKGTCYGNPLFPLTGVKRQSQSLGVSIGRRSLSVTYDTRNKMHDVSGNLTWLASGLDSFGELWQSSLHKRIVFQGTGTAGSATSAAAVQRGDNVWETFLGDGAGHYVSTVDPKRRIVSIGSGWGLLDGAGAVEETYDAGGVAQTMVDADGHKLTFAYSDASTPPSVAPVPGLLIGVSDQFGRTLAFTYEAVAGGNPRINTITSADAQLTRIGYDASGNLSSIGWPGAPASQALTFAYGNGSYPWALTGVTGEDSRAFATYGYDADGRASSTEHAGSVDKFAVDYGTNDSTKPKWQVTESYDSQAGVVWRTHDWSANPTPPVVTNPFGQSISLTSTFVGGMNLLSSQSQPAGSGCAASVSSRAYDANSNVVRLDDFNGTRTCYAYDTSRNLETFRLEGLPTSKACPADLSSYAPSPVDAAHPERKTGTLWHPDWALKVREAAPKKITTWVYNGQPDPIATGTASCAPAGAVLPDGKPIAVVCKRYEQSTDDASGARNFAPTTIVGTRAWSYTYNLNGQVLSETAPKLSSTDTLSHTTNYTYYTYTSFPDGATGHTVGDLKKVVDPLGYPTQFTLYDKAGRPLSSTDANGAVTTRAYWPRGWVHTVTVTPAAGGGAAQTTTYDYWPTGLLHVVTQPDGSTLTYAYDDAHRLTDVTDGAGNTVHYVLDNQGNRTSETVQDASGKLASAIARAYDNLNRLQTVTGAAQ
jgi:YD repeat-containing protein